MPSIAELCKKHGSDKYEHGYCKYYDKHFEEYRDKDIMLCEIGVAQGYSVKAWLDYFPTAGIIGMDIGEQPFEHPRFSFQQGDQGNWLALPMGLFDIIIDDGSHKTIHILQTIAVMYDSLKNNGLYVIEDLDSRRAKGCRKLLKRMEYNFDVLEFTDTLWIGRKCIS